MSAGAGPLEDVTTAPSELHSEDTEELTRQRRACVWACGPAVTCVVRVAYTGKTSGYLRGSKLGKRTIDELNNLNSNLLLSAISPAPSLLLTHFHLHTLPSVRFHLSIQIRSSERTDCPR